MFSAGRCPTAVSSRVAYSTCGAPPSFWSVIRQPSFAAPSTQAWTAEVTSSWTQSSARRGTAYVTAGAGPTPGWLLHVTVDSVQPEFTTFTWCVRPIASGRIVVKQSLSCALPTFDPNGIPDRSNSTNERSLPLARITVAVPKFWLAEPAST
jgi:hypothetical protein